MCNYEESRAIPKRQSTVQEREKELLWHTMKINCKREKKGLAKVVKKK